MCARVHFSGPASYRLKSAALLSRTIPEVCLRRSLHGARRPSWNLNLELGTEIIKRQLMVAFQMTDPQEARSYLDSIALSSGHTSEVGIHRIEHENFRGSWFLPKERAQDRVIFYLHGGGYSFFPRSFYDDFTALLATMTRARVFTLDYGLAPEHRFPAQLMEASAAYLWLLESGIAPEHLSVVGDSAGGNLTLSLMLSLRDARSALPAIAVCLSPATDFSLTALDASELDWITPEMALGWAEWFCSALERTNPLVSPIYGDFRGLPPICIQAGGAEMLLPCIRDFAAHAQSQGADVKLDVWPDMPHVFQAFGTQTPQSMAALEKIAEVIAASSPKSKAAASKL
jgi:acetyl esterase/lipase